jgi:hypothetical protein
VPESDLVARVADLEAEVLELKSLQELMLRLLSTTRPLSNLLQYYGANETREQALYRLLDDLADRTHGPEHRLPTFGPFKVRLGEIFPELRDDRQFVQLIIDTLKVERPAYKQLYDYMAKHRWPVWE